jgi:hypothetical protein
MLAVGKVRRAVAAVFGGLSVQILLGNAFEGGLGKSDDCPAGPVAQAAARVEVEAKDDLRAQSQHQPLGKVDVFLELVTLRLPKRLNGV